MVLHNYMEDIVRGLLDELLADKPALCGCEKCHLDMMALALNKLHPKYVVTDKGRVYVKLAELELQFRADVARELAKAIDFVKAHPKH